MVLMPYAFGPCGMEMELICCRRQRSPHYCLPLDPQEAHQLGLQAM